jgi:hypothetical protein
MLSGVRFAEADLRALAGEKSFRRGVDYLDAVGGLSVKAGRVTATVHGSEDYTVVLAAGDGSLRGECDCPQGQQGFFCKHCVAVGLAMVRNKPFVPAQRIQGKNAAAQPTPASPTAHPGGQDRPAGLRQWLAGRSSQELLALILDQIAEDDNWRRRLELRAAGAGASLRAALDRIDELVDAAAFTPYGYIEEGDALRYARRLRAAAAVVVDLAETGHAADAVKVAEHAITAAALACRNARDESGAIAEAAHELVACHHAACLIVPADPGQLAGFIAGRLLSPDDMPCVDVEFYREALGKEGLAELRELCAAAWRASPGGVAEQRALEEVLLVTGDTDALVGMLSADLDPLGAKHLRIAVELEAAGRFGEALEWAERGLRETRPPDAALADFVAERYGLAGRLADAVAVRRDRFAAARDLAGYEQLREAAGRAGEWPATREWALGLLRADASAATVGGEGWQRGRVPEPVLIDALMSDGELDAAWEAATGVASQAQWLRLADLAAERRPADALAVYLRQVQALRSEAGERAYERMARLLASARACHERLGTSAEFEEYLRALRADQKRRPKLLAILARHQL